MALKHDSVLDGNLGITGCLIHELRTTIEDVSLESMGPDGTFASGKSIRKKTTLACSGEMLDTASLPTVGSGDGLASTTPHIDRTEQRDQNEGASEFSAEGHFFAAGEGDWA